MAVPELFEQANKLNLAGNYDEAGKLYDQLLTQNPTNPYLMATVGTMFLQSKDEHKLGLAITLLHGAVDKLKTPQSDILANLGIAYKYSGQHDKAMDFLTKACEHDPSPGTLASYGSMFVNRGNPEKGIPYFERALKIDPQQQLAHWNLSLAMLETGKWDRAWEHHEWGMEAGGLRPDRHTSLPRWDGTPGKKILVYGEQGIGDEIMFASMLPDLMKDNEVVLECHTRLVNLFERAFGVKCYGTREDPNAVIPETVDCRVAIGSLGKWFRRSKDEFPGTPYLKADAAPRGDKFRVGISWTGGRAAKRVAIRSVPLSWWKTILNNDCEFVSLQYTDCADEIKVVEDSGYTIKQFPEVMAHDYYETARLVKSCDLVISVCTSVIHLAGALGVPCWVMVPNMPAWRYQNAGPIPWYRSVRLYRQPKGEDASWRPVIERVGYDLEQLIGQEQRVAYG